VTPEDFQKAQLFLEAHLRQVPLTEPFGAACRLLAPRVSAPAEQTADVGWTGRPGDEGMLGSCCGLEGWAKHFAHEQVGVDETGPLSGPSSGCVPMPGTVAGRLWRPLLSMDPRGRWSASSSCRLPSSQAC
jgi:hypothetical protein